MAIKITCSCGKSLEASDDKAGLRGRCPFCKAVIVMPAPQPVDPRSEDDGKPPKIAVVGRTDIENADFPSEAARERARRAIAGGYSTGFFRIKPTFGKPLRTVP